MIKQIPLTLKEEQVIKNAIANSIKKMSVEEITRFIKNCNCDFRNITAVYTYSDKIKHYDIISWAFVWDSTPEGHEYWEKIASR